MTQSNEMKVTEEILTAFYAEANEILEEGICEVVTSDQVAQDIKTLLEKTLWKLEQVNK